MTTCEKFPKNTYRYHPAISEWMYLVESKQFVACKEQKELMDFVKEKLDDPEVVIDNEKIDKAIERAERYFFTMYPFQRFFIAFVVGVYWKTGELLFNEYLFLAGRGTGKNGLLSTLIFNLPIITKVPKYNIDIVATTEKQAKTSFEEVFDVIDESQKIQKSFKHTMKTIIHRKTKSKIEYHTSNARSKDGLRSGAVIFDEIHEFENDELIRVFRSGLGKKGFPRTFYLTTDGYVRGGFLDELKGIARQILKGDIKTRNLLPFIFKLDDPEEVHDKKMWLKAIPMLAYSKTLLRQVTEEYEIALDSSSAMIEFLTKRMNIPAQDAFTAVADWEEIEQTEQEVPDLTGFQCVGGVDFATLRDFVAVGLLFRIGDKRYWIHHTFICHKSLKLTKFKFDIDRAVAEGYATIVKTDMVLPETVADWFLEMKKKYNIINIAADSWRFRELSDQFQARGMPLKEVRSGPITHGKISGLVDSLFALKNIVFGKDFMMRWYTNNVYVKFDGKGNRTYEKIEPKTRKTDGFMALIHALTIEPEYKPPMKYHSSFKTVTY